MQIHFNETKSQKFFIVIINFYYTITCFHRRIKSKTISSTEHLTTSQNSTFTFLFWTDKRLNLVPHTYWSVTSRYRLLRRLIDNIFSLLFNNKLHYVNHHFKTYLDVQNWIMGFQSPKITASLIHNSQYNPFFSYVYNLTMFRDLKIAFIVQTHYKKIHQSPKFHSNPSVHHPLILHLPR